MTLGVGGSMGADAALAVVERERATWEALLAEVGEGRKREPGPMGAWSFKDLVAHLSAWCGHTLARLEAAADGRPEPPPPWPAHLREDDRINVWFHERNRDRPLADVLCEARQGYDRLAAVVPRLPVDALHDPARFPWLEGPSLATALVDGSLLAHLHEDHEPAVRIWLAERSAGG